MNIPLLCTAQNGNAGTISLVLSLVPSPISDSSERNFPISMAGNQAENAGRRICDYLFVFLLVN